MTSHDSDARRQLIDHISRDAVFHGDFTLTSGKKATYYVDLRKVSLDHRVAPLIGQVMLDLIAEERAAGTISTREEALQLVERERSR